MIPSDENTYKTLERVIVDLELERARTCSKYIQRKKTFLNSRDAFNDVAFLERYKTRSKKSNVLFLRKENIPKKV